MIIQDNFKIEKSDELNFSIYELVEKDEYKKGTFGVVEKTGDKKQEWIHRAYRSSVKSAFSKVADLMVEKGFECSKDVKELIKNIESIKTNINSNI